jgi:hypothetical protein
MIRPVRLPLKDLSLAWYEATERFGAYDVHPAKAEDWNLETGGDTDLGAGLVAPFSGFVTSAFDWGGKRGGIMQIIGVVPGREEIVVWAGWHVQNWVVRAGQVVTVGQDLAEIGNVGGFYAAHLHEQIALVRAGDRHGIPAPRTYPTDARYKWVRPSEWYKAMGVPEEEVEKARRYDGR